MKRVLMLLLLAAAVSAIAADDTEKVLDAQRVDVLRFTHNTADPKKPFVLWTDEGRQSGILEDKNTFTAAGAVPLTYADFNPFLASVTSTQATRKDPVQEAIEKFAAELATMTKVIAPDPAALTGGGGAGARGSAKCALLAAQARDAVNAERHQAIAGARTTAKSRKTKFTPAMQAPIDLEYDAKVSAAFETVIEACGTCEDLTARANDLNRAFLKADGGKGFDPKTLTGWVREATGLAGVVKVAGEVEAARDDAKQVRDDAVAAIDFGEKLIKDSVAADDRARELAEGLRTAGLGSMEIASCPALAAGTLLKVQSQVKALGEIVEGQNTLLESLNKLLATLRVYEKQTWRNGKDLVFDTAVTDPAAIKVPTVTFKALTYSFDKATTAIQSKVDHETVRTFDVRRLRRLVAEYGMAVLYNDLKYPKYSVKDEAGVKTVAQEFDTSNVNLAATLNFLCGSCIGSGVYPGFQFGLSKAKDYPGLLAGGVLRFGGTTRISVASGVMVTWYKDLGKLKVDGPVESEDKLKNDLKLRHSSGAWYLAVQYTFP